MEDAKQAAQPDFDPPKHSDAFNAREFIRHLPKLPGVYRMLSEEGKILYVGKAKDLKKRVSSYFQKTNHSPRIRLMIRQIARIETTVTRTEAEALLLENNLIKSLEPRYNILFRDDKSYPYVCITQEKVPQLRFHRGKTDQKHWYFGPFPNAVAVREGIHLLEKVFQLRSCDNTVFQNRSRPCMLHQIKRCSAPCVGKITPEDYQTDVHHAVHFMQGKTDEVVHALQAQMHTHAQNLNFELAAIARNKIFSLQQIRAKQFVLSQDEQDSDVIGIATSDGLVAINVAMFRGGRHIGDKTYFPKLAEVDQPAEILLAFLAQQYLGQIVPSTLMIGPDNPKKEIALLQEALSKEAQRKIAILQASPGEKKVWLQMANANAQLAIQQKIAQKTTQQERLHALRVALQEPLQLEQLERIECFDISHTQGEAAVASCVVFDEGALQTSQYRRFNVSPAQAGDDYAAMGEALQRRLHRMQQGETPIPDLLIVDGGKGQVGIAAAVVQNVGLPQIRIIGIAKGPERKAGQEEIFFANNQNSLQLPETHPGLHLLQQIRDEAHRFAIQGHRARRSKNRTTSSLQEIPGVGPKRRALLLAHFGGLRGLAAASLEEIAHTPGINQKLAAMIYQSLH